MTTADDLNGHTALAADPVLAALENGIGVLALAVVAEATIAKGVQLSEQAWREIEAAAACPAIEYPPGYVPVPDDDLASAIGNLDCAAVTRLAQLGHPMRGHLTVMEHDSTSTTVVGEKIETAEDPATGFDATVAALTVSGWDLLYLETVSTRVQDALRAETARRRAEA